MSLYGSLIGPFACKGKDVQSFYARGKKGNHCLFAQYTILMFAFSKFVGDQFYCDRHKPLVLVVYHNSSTCGAIGKQHICVCSLCLLHHTNCSCDNCGGQLTDDLFAVVVLP